MSDPVNYTQMNAQIMLRQEQAMGAVQKLQMASLQFQNDLTLKQGWEKAGANLTMASREHSVQLQQKVSDHRINMVKARLVAETNKDEYGRLIKNKTVSDADLLDPYFHIT